MAWSDATWDVLFDAMERAGKVTGGTVDRGALLQAIHETDLETVVGRIKFNDQNYSVAPLGGAQWRRAANGDLVKENVFNEVYPEVKITGEMRLYQQ